MGLLNISATTTMVAEIGTKQISACNALAS
jgi:hypothetical protein